MTQQRNFEYVLLNYTYPCKASDRKLGSLGKYNLQLLIQTQGDIIWILPVYSIHEVMRNIKGHWQIVLFLIEWGEDNKKSLNLRD